MLHHPNWTQSPIPAAGASAPSRHRAATAAEPSPGQAAAERALAQMKGCHVYLEGVDECAIAYLSTLSPAELNALVGLWHHGLGFPTVSRLAALQEACGLGRGSARISRAGDAA